MIIATANTKYVILQIVMPLSLIILSLTSDRSFSDTMYYHVLGVFTGYLAYAALIFLVGIYSLIYIRRNRFISCDDKYLYIIGYTILKLSDIIDVDLDETLFGFKRISVNSINARRLVSSYRINEDINVVFDKLKYLTNGGVKLKQQHC